MAGVSRRRLARPSALKARNTKGRCLSKWNSTPSRIFQYAIRSIMAAKSGSVRPGTALPALSSPWFRGSWVREERSIQTSIAACSAGSSGVSAGLPGGACSAA